jgi:hypothetical protein
MKAVLAVTLGLAISMSAGLRAASNSHTAFPGGVGVTSPCNGEGVSGTGPVKIVYVESDDHFVVHFSFKASGVGNQGNSYQFSFEGNGQFDAPTGVSGALSWFDVPVNGEVITKGGAPNFDWDLGIRVFVVNGHATGALFIGPSTTTCHG